MEQPKLEELLKWLQAEKKATQDAGKLLGLNTNILEQHYDKIITKVHTTIVKN